MRGAGRAGLDLNETGGVGDAGDGEEGSGGEALRFVLSLEFVSITFVKFAWAQPKVPCFWSITKTHLLGPEKQSESERHQLSSQLKLV